MSTLLVLGATSDMARATALKFALNGWDIQFAGRNQEKVSVIAQDIAVRSGRKTSAYSFNVLESESASQLWESLPEKPDVVLCAIGLLGDQQVARHDMSLAGEILQSNFTGLVPILSLTADYFEEQRNGCIIGISSVAGGRGRASNYIYGSAKAGFTAFLSGLRSRLARKKIHIMTVKPGFVATRMTEGMELPPTLTASPDEIATAIWNGFNKKRNIIYVKPIWRLVIFIIKHIPECIFKFTKI